MRGGAKIAYLDGPLLFIRKKLSICLKITFKSLYLQPDIINLRYEKIVNSARSNSAKVKNVKKLHNQVAMKLEKENLCF